MTVHHAAVGRQRVNADDRRDRRTLIGKGKLTDEGTRKVITTQLEGFAGFINRVGPKG